jgi:hypothetical protein
MEIQPMYRIVHFLSIAILLIGLTVPAYANDETGTVPSFKDIIGFNFGEDITRHYQMVRYLEALAAASPRVTLVRQGVSWEGRELLLAIVTAPENHRRLDEIRENAQRLGDPRILSGDEAGALYRDQPVIVWLGGSIHGFELSGTEGMLKLLEHLTTRDDEATRFILQNAVVLIDPILNPDGRDAHVSYNIERLGSEPNAEQFDWVNDTNWWEALKFRTNHYYFDMNRDWFAHTQQETRARVATFRQWRPQAGVDAHEMGVDVEFYFDPPTDPVSPYFPDYTTKWFEVFGRAHAQAFDEAGFEYTTREMFNYFYPAYTTSYLSYQGAVGMLYEQGQTRGLAIRRSDGSVRTLYDGLEQQYTASLAMVRTAAENREGLLRDYYEAHRAAVEAGRTGVRRYLLKEENDPSLLAELVNLLLRNGIEVHRLDQSTELNGVRDRTGQPVGRQTFTEGSYLIEAAQPRMHLLRALLEPDIPMPEEFLEEARARVDRGENPRFYDVTAYSLPLLFNVDVYGTTDTRSVNAERLTEEVEPVYVIPDRNARYAYLIDGRQTKSVTALYYLRDMGYRVAMMTEETRFDGRTFARGTVVVRVNRQIDGVHGAVREIAERYGLDIYPIDTGLPERGFTPPGSPTTIDFRKPEIALVAEFPVFGYSFGWAWYTLDRQYEIPHTILRVRSLGNTNLDRFDVIVLPSVSGAMFAREVGEEGVERLKRWVRDGGTLVAIGGGATDFVREQLEITKLRSWYDTDEGKEKQQISVPGALLRVKLNGNTWMSAGYGETLPVLVNSDRLYLPADEPPSPSRRVVAQYEDREQLRLAGHLWEESLERLPGAVFAYEERVGRGRVITFAEEVNFRAYTRGLNRLFLNAVVVSPSAP